MNVSEIVEMPIKYSPKIKRDARTCNLAML